MQSVVASVVPSIGKIFVDGDFLVRYYLISFVLAPALWFFNEQNLFLFSEVQADETIAVDAVVNADTKRLNLLAECTKLEKEAEKGVDNTEKLKQVGFSGWTIINV